MFVELPDSVTGSKQVVEESPTVGVDHPSVEHAGLDDPQVGTRFALPHRGVPGAHDDEGEWFEHAQRANNHRHHPPGTLAVPSDTPSAPSR